MKILFLADLHIHYPKKVPKEWQYNRFMLLADEINKVECDFVLLGGDTLDSAKPSTAELELFFDFLAKIERNGGLYSGNHEMQTKKHSILWDLRSEIERSTNFKVIGSNAYGKDFDVVDYPHIQAPYTKHNDICFTHVRGAIEPHVKPEVDLSIFSEYRAVFAGDLHSNENSQLNILYPGSPLTTSFHRTRATKSNGMYLINTKPFSYDWINLSHLPQLIRKTISDPADMIPTEYDYTVYELEGSIVDLMGMENMDLLDKKVNNVVTKDSKLELKTLSLNAQMQLYLKEIQHLPEETISRLIRRFNKYATNKTNLE